MTVNGQLLVQKRKTAWWHSRIASWIFDNWQWTILKEWWTVLTMKLSNSRWSWENTEIHVGSWNSWYCESCDARDKLTALHTTDVVLQLSMLLSSYFTCGIVALSVEYRTCDQEVVGSSLGRARSVETLGKFLTPMCLCSPSSTSWYQPKGGDALRLGSKGRYGLCVGGR